jgi:spoIIIJ-associated protein
MDFVEVEGKTYEEAVKKAAASLDAEEKDLDIEVTEVDTKGILGLLGSKKIRITARRRTDSGPEGADAADAAGLAAGMGAAGAAEGPGGRAHEAEEYAKKFLKDVAALCDVALRVDVQGESDRLLFHIEASDAEAITGRDGEVLEALQHLVKLAIAKKYGQNVKLLLDVDGFREQRKRSIVAMARKLADRARREGRPQWTKPLNPYERRVIHTLFKNHEGVTTHSEGTGHLKKVVITSDRQRPGGGGGGRPGGGLTGGRPGGQDGRAGGPAGGSGGRPGGPGAYRE